MNREALKSMYALEFPKWSGTHPRIVMASLCTKCFTSPILTLTWGDGVNLELVYMHKFIEFDRAPCRKGFQHLTDFGWGGIPACICAGVHDCLHTHTRKTFPLHCFSHLSLSQLFLCQRQLHGWFGLTSSGHHLLLQVDYLTGQFPTLKPLTG